MLRPLHVLLAADSLPDRLLAEVAFDAQDVPVHVTYCEGFWQLNLGGAEEAQQVA